MSWDSLLKFWHRFCPNKEQLPCQKVAVPDCLVHIGGVRPFNPTLIRGASTVPSGCFAPAATMIFAPGLRSAAVAGTKLTTVALAGTMNVFSPSLYFRTSV